MKVLLTIFCGLAILLAGGCVLLTGRELGPIGLLNFAIIVPNALMIAAMYGLSGPMRPVFITFALIDIGLALLVMVVALSEPSDQTVMTFAVLIAALFVAKAVLTFKVSGRLRER